MPGCGASEIDPDREWADIFPNGNRLKINVLPKPNGDKMGQITRFWMLPLIAQVIDGALQVGRVP